jgi:hypothetical protein
MSKRDDDDVGTEYDDEEDVVVPIGQKHRLNNDSDFVTCNLLRVTKVTASYTTLQST